MAHKTLVGGTAYNISGGKSMVSGTVYNIAKGKTLVGGTGYDINFGPDASTILNDNDWETISAVATAGLAQNYWSVGDTKEVVINGTVGQTTFSSLSVWAFILGFDHNSDIEGTGKIHFQIGKTAQTGGTAICLVDSKYGSSVSSAAGYFSMNYSNSNSGGWASSKMRTVLLGNSNTPASPLSGSLMAALPSDLRSVMKACTKYSDNTGGSDTASYVTSTTDYLWLLAEYEVRGTRKSANSAEKNYQQQYAYYANYGNSKIKYRHSSTSSTAIWWLRSASAPYSTYFCGVGTSGSAYYPYANYSYGVAPAFCV